MLIKMFKGLGIKNGVLSIQFFVEDGKFYAYDPGFRLQGEAPDVIIDAINSFDHKSMLINFALTGSMGVNDLVDRNDFWLRGKHACTLWILLKKGVINQIKGFVEIQEDDSVVFIMQRFSEGDIIQEFMLGTEKQVFARIYIVSETKEGLFNKINSIKAKISIIDEDGEDMILDFFNASTQEKRL